MGASLIIVEEKFVNVRTYSKVLNEFEIPWILPALIFTLFAFGSLAGLRTLRPEASGSIARGAPAGSVLTVKLQHALSSKHERAGDEFKAAVVSMSASDGKAIPMNGAWVRGRCVAVREQEGPGRPGYLRLSLTDLHDGKGHV